MNNNAKKLRDSYLMTANSDKEESLTESIKQYFTVLIMSLVMALNYEIFILPNNFAPAGINGIATMIQYKLGFNIGYMNLIINIPLCFLAFWFLNKSYSLKTLCFCVSFSLFLFVLKGNIYINKFAFHPENNANSTLASIVAGTINGFIYGCLIKNNSSSGGTDIVSAIVRCFKPHFSLSWIIFALNSIVALVSFFVYDYRYEPVILCILYCYITGKVSESMLRGFREEIKYEIVTEHPDEIAGDIINKLNHGVTETPAKGMYTNKEKNLLICIINKHQIFELQKILKKYPETFAYVSNVSETLGNFKKIHG